VILDFFLKIIKNLLFNVKAVQAGTGTHNAEVGASFEAGAETF
jgi:hypothetical protein